jgi:glucosamine kinase
MTVVIGVDAGGTRTIAAVSEADRVLSRVEGAAGAVRPGRAMTAAGTIATTVRRALAPTGRLRGDVLVVGASGVGREDERQALRDALRMENLAERLIITTDIEIALVAAFGDGSGIVLLSGTGSFAVGRLADGTQRRQGGYGWQMGDEGSAYALGLAALRAVGQAHDGRAQATSLESALLAVTRARGFDDLIRWSVAAMPIEVAGLAAAVLQAADSGDAVAVALVARAVGDLAELVAALVRAFPGAEPVPVALAGGLLSQATFRSAVLDALTPLARLRVLADPLDPVEGALRLGRGT